MIAYPVRTGYPQSGKTQVRGIEIHFIANMVIMIDDSERKHSENVLSCLFGTIINEGMIVDLTLVIRCGSDPRVF